MLTHTLNVKPLSANQMWKGRRFKSSAYRKYIDDCLWLLPNRSLPEGPYRLMLVIKLENVAADLDNPIKAFIDVLQTKYGFNDKAISEIHAYKEVVPKGEGGIVWSIDPLRSGGRRTGRPPTR